jgi:SSS family solute:Na+ symporter
VVVFSAADYFVFGLFILVVLALGFSAKLKRNTSVELVAAGRRLTLPLFVATLVTTWYGGVLGTGEFWRDYGLATLTVNGLPYWSFGLLFAFVMASKIRGAEQISLPERIGRCYGRHVGILAAVLVMLLATPASYLLMLGTLINMTTGLALAPAIVVGGVIGTLFLYRGGLLADARSNTISFLMMYAAFIVILIIAIGKYGAPSQIIANLPTEQRTWDAGNGIIWVLSWFLVGSWTFVDPGFHQRVAAVGSPRKAFVGVLIAVGLWVIFDSMTTFTAMYGSHALPGGSSLGINLFPTFGNAMLPAGVKGMFFAGMFGAVLAATVGYTFVSGSTIGRDLFGRLRPDATEAQLALYTRVGIAIATLLGIGLAAGAQSVVTLWFDIPGIVIPGLVVPVVGAYATRRRPSTAVALSCLIAGSGSALTWYLWGKFGTLPPGWASVTPILIGSACALLIWGIALAISDKGAIDE